MTAGEDTPGEEGAEDRTRLVLSQPATSIPPAAPPVPMPRAPRVATVAIGTLINNNYIVREVLKAGGMGEVYRGENVFTHDPVAIKVVLQELAEDEKVGQMFLREARTLSQLSDEAIVRYYNFVKDPGIDRYCLVMEFIEGVTLADYTHRNGGLPREAALSLMRRLARGLDKAHARGVIHRDLSPDNVMLPGGIVADALLIDFGIAKSKFLQESSMAGEFAGKFKYVAPEQLGHYGGEIGPQADIYGLALLMAAALRGKPLDMGSSIVEAVDARRAIPDLSSLPESFRPILSWMLEPDPANRVASMADVARLLDRPTEVPAKYRAGLSQSVPPVNLSLPPGLALPPGSTMRTATLPPRPLEPTGRAAMPDPVAPESTWSRGGPLWLLFGVFILVMGGALGFAWQQGLFDPVTPLADTEALPSGTAAKPTDPAAFVAALDLGPCALALLTGTDEPLLQVFSTQTEGFARVALDYQREFGTSPRVQSFLLTEAQCPALDLARAFQATSGVRLATQAATVTSGDPVEGQVAVPEGQALWLAVISPRGNVYKLNQSLSGQIAGEQGFSFGLALPDGTASAPHLMLAVATPSPLANAAAARDGVQADVLLPQVTEELARIGGTVSLAQITLVAKATPAPSPPVAP